jgi:hypothetical protein
MNDPAAFRTWLDQATITAPRSPDGIPLIGLDQLDLKEANAAALVNAMADIIVATCSHTALAMPAAATSTKAA